VRKHATLLAATAGIAVVVVVWAKRKRWVKLATSIDYISSH